MQQPVLSDRHVDDATATTTTRTTTNISQDNSIRETSATATTTKTTSNNIINRKQNTTINTTIITTDNNINNNSNNSHHNNNNGVLDPNMPSTRSAHPPRRSTSGSLSSSVGNSAVERRMSPLPSPTVSSSGDQQQRDFIVGSHRSPSPTNDSCEPGTVLENKYTIIRKLGSGAFSTVVLAKPLNSSDNNNNTSTLFPSQTSTGFLPPDDSTTTSTTTTTTKFPPTPSPSPLHLSVDSAVNTTTSTITTTSSSSASASLLDSNQVYAIKMVSKKLYDANDRTRIASVREVDVLMKLHHPNLVRLLDSFVSPSYECLVLEHARGGELYDLVESFQSSFTTKLCIRIFSELAHVVAWMHDMGIVHRDIKLENILLTQHPFESQENDNTSDFLSLNLPDPNTPLIKLSDFGLSRSIDPESPLLRTRCGSEEYAAPEIIMGKPYDATLTDSWALGVVLFSILTSQLPFSVLQSSHHHNTTTSTSATANNNNNSNNSDTVSQPPSDQHQQQQQQQQQEEKFNDNGTSLANGAVGAAALSPTSINNKSISCASSSTSSISRSKLHPLDTSSLPSVDNNINNSNLNNSATTPQSAQPLSSSATIESSSSIMGTPVSDRHSSFVSSPDKMDHQHHHQQQSTPSRQYSYEQRLARKSFLMRIAKAQYVWPPESLNEHEYKNDNTQDVEKVARQRQYGLVSPLARDLVDKLLVRDPSKRISALHIVKFGHDWLNL